MTLRGQHILSWILICSIALILSACGNKERENKLDSALHTYTKSIRWNRMDIAATMVQPRENDGEQKIELEIYDGLQVASSDVIINSVSEDYTEATVTLAISYFFRDDNVLRNLQKIDFWYFDAESERWLLDGSLPSFKRD